VSFERLCKLSKNYFGANFRINLKYESVPTNCELEIDSMSKQKMNEILRLMEQEVDFF
jgi:hypothetical protein